MTKKTLKDAKKLAKGKNRDSYIELLKTYSKLKTQWVKVNYSHIAYCLWIYRWTVSAYLKWYHTRPVEELCNKITWYLNNIDAYKDIKVPVRKDCIKCCSEKVEEKDTDIATAVKTTETEIDKNTVSKKQSRILDLIFVFMLLAVLIFITFISYTNR